MLAWFQITGRALVFVASLVCAYTIVLHSLNTLFVVDPRAISNISRLKGRQHSSLTLQAESKLKMNPHVAKAVGLNNFRGLKEYVLGDQKSAKRREWIPEQVPCSQEILSRIQTRYLEERYQLLEDLKQVDLDGFDLDRFEIEPIVASIISPLIYKHGDVKLQRGLQFEGVAAGPEYSFRRSNSESYFMALHVVKSGKTFGTARKMNLLQLDALQAKNAANGIQERAIFGAITDSSRWEFVRWNTTKKASKKPALDFSGSYRLSSLEDIPQVCGILNWMISHQPQP